jgi:hypothetical protein
MIDVAIATENNDFDGVIYRELLERLLGKPVRDWQSDQPVLFTNGWVRVIQQAPTWLKLAARAGVRHALIAIDNDGAPEHVPQHDLRAQADDPDGCCTCRLLQKVSSAWSHDDRHACVVVPVQMIETWLLVLGGHAFATATPEQEYKPKRLKGLFKLTQFPGIDRVTQRMKLARALELIRQPQALHRLRERPSFQRFEAQVASWL